MIRAQRLTSISGLKRSVFSSWSRSGVEIMIKIWSPQILKIRKGFRLKFRLQKGHFLNKRLYGFKEWL